MNIRLHKKYTLSPKEQTSLLASVLAFSLCISLSMYHMSDHPAITASRYVIAILCVIVSTLVYPRLRGTTVLLFLCFAISGMLNLLLIGNMTYVKMLYILMSISIALLLCNPLVSPRYLLYAMYIHACIIAYRFLRYGLHTLIYVKTSNNYVSFHLLIPITVYYTLLECWGERIPVLPAFVTFILSVLAMGRGGVISAGILLAGILLYSIKKLRPVYRMILFASMALGAAVMIHVSRTWEIATRFNRLGMSDNGRFDIWKQYLHSALTNKLYFWLGAKFDELPLVVYFENNLHNSFLSIHAINGIVALALVCFLSLYTFFYAIRRKRFILLTCMTSLFFRGFTDQMLWGATATPFMLFFFMIPQVHFLYLKRAAAPID